MFSQFSLWFVCVALLASNTWAQVVINEVATSNATTVENPQDSGKFPDWVELYNRSQGTENLIGMSLVFTNYQGTNRFTFTANTFIDSQKYLIIWFDNDTNAPGIHAGYNLPKTDGGNVLLVRPDLTVADSVTENGVTFGFGLQVTDLTIGRIPDGTGLFQLTVPTPALANVAQALGSQFNLRYNEWMATNSAGADKDWLELYNADPLPVPLGNLLFTDQITGLANEKRIPPLSFIAGGGFIRFWCDGHPKQGADHLDFNLSSTSGEPNVSIFLPDLVTYVDRISFAAGQLRDRSEGRLPDGSDNIVRPFALGKDTPGASNFQPLTNVVINEVLTHTDPPFEDAIELYNPNSTNVDISYWWLSNRKDDAKKFQIPAGTTILANSYVVFYEQVGSTGGFNTSGTGTSPDFTLNSANGDEVYLFTGDSSGNLTGYRRSIDFGPAFNGVSFGRYILSTGDSDITAMSSRTFGGPANPVNVLQFRTGTGATNSYPVVGPVVINEIMYKPVNINVTNDNSIDEYIELHNITATNVNLFIAQMSNAPGGALIPFTNGWKLDDAVKFTFPGRITMDPNGYLLVVNFDPVTNTTQLAEFRAKFNVPSSFTSIYGPYGGKLKNSSASIKLYAPDNVQSSAHPDVGLVPYVLVDKVNYSDGPPFWPAQPDGFGASLQRRHRSEYGNDPINWGALAPTPGRTNMFTGMVKVQYIDRLASRIEIVFMATNGQPYTVEMQDALTPTGPWAPLTNIISGATIPTPVSAYDTNVTATRFYRIKTPVTP